ncbi:uncharacterized protein N7459_001808 [Penicillium hispanicum]|uniref:uncharacterized protein n=1 Tax=Penicillium hispanicum TaxID=1080232 RepID=UPI0025419EF0|nr:uncharacterized protein N7459_001808 [Penicillium hispanicum]KAJ5595600.1 hypothetical protein N7459_001808 [Penicillium hispanicum]
MKIWPLELLVYSLYLVSQLDFCLSFELQPVGPRQVNSATHAARDKDLSGLDLLSIESFLWGGSQNDRSAVGNFTVHMPGQTEHIISMERFQPFLESTHCTNQSVTLRFRNERSFQYGQRIWQWVNEADERNFVVVAGQGHCGWNEDRLPFVVSNVSFLAENQTIRLNGHASDWKTVAHTYELFVGGHPAGAKRDWDHTFSLDFSHPFPLSRKSFSVGDATFTYDCEECGTTGEFEFSFHITTEAFRPTGVSMTLSPHGVAANFNPRLGLSANFTGAKSDEVELGKIPIDGVTIPGGVLDLGPEIVFSLGYGLEAVVGTAGIATGVSVSLTDAADLTFDLTSPDVSASGWTPHVSKKPMTLDASISGSIQINVKAAVELSLEALDTGFQIGLDLEPWAGATLTLGSGSESVCPEDSEPHHVGIQVAPSAGVNLNVEASEAGGEGDPFLSTAIASVTIPLPSMCTGFGSPPTVVKENAYSGSRQRQSSSPPAPSSSRNPRRPPLTIHPHPHHSTTTSTPSSPEFSPYHRRAHLAATRKDRGAHA